MLGWGVVTIVRGPIVGWYPYFFLDPAQLADVGQFALYGTISIALFAGITAAVVSMSNTRPLAERWVDRVTVRRSRRAQAPP